MTDFFQQGYEVPTTSGYMKFEEGANTFRILGKFTDGSAIMGTEYWVTGEGGKRMPKRVPMGQNVEVSELELNPKTGEQEQPKHFWAMPVWNYAAKKVQILEITQKGIMNSIKALAENKKWGDPLNYDIVVTRTEASGKTTYSVMPEPKEALKKEILEEYKRMNLNLKALFIGQDPFNYQGSEVVDEINLDDMDKEEVKDVVY
jgi:hypothetical protein